MEFETHCDTEAEAEVPKEPPKIHRLDESVVNRIAAGEVIQRPVSAVKELVENSLDAHSSSINVVVKDGGLKLIQVSDDGHGIRFDDLAILCERHTTSKLSTFEDLQSIKSMGFRGEALASMTYVAHVTVSTITKGQLHGYRVSYRDGVMEHEPKPCAAVKGTQIMVENLFYNMTARRKTLQNSANDFSNIEDLLKRFSIHHINVNFSLRKHGASGADLHTVGTSSRLDAIRSVYGVSVARTLIKIETSDNNPSSSVFKMNGFISDSNYVAKKITMVLFINDRLVECTALKRAIEIVYSATLPKASKPFIYMSIVLPPEHVDVNVHPTKREVSLLNQEVIIAKIQSVVESKLRNSNEAQTFQEQIVEPSPSGKIGIIKDSSFSSSPSGSKSQKVPVHKMVRTDSLDPAGRLHHYLQAKPRGPLENNPSLTAVRSSVRQRRNQKETADLTSIQELINEIDCNCHSGLLDVVRHCSYIGMADDVLALLQHDTHLYVANVVNLSKELMYQQVLRRFAHFNAIQLSDPAPLSELIMLALKEEDLDPECNENDDLIEKITEMNTELLKQKAEMLEEYFGIHVDVHGNLSRIPVILDQYTPDMDRVPEFVLCLGNDVDWEDEKRCFQVISAALGNFYAMHPPMLPNPSGDGLQYYTGEQSSELNSLSFSLTNSTESEFIFRENLIAGSSVLSLGRLSVLIFPAMYNSRAQTLFLLLLLHSVLLAPLVSAQGSKWSTLSGNPPKVIANGGFSGIFPSSTSYAYNLALLVSVPDVVLWCDVQLTKDGVGICAPDLLLSNSSDIADIFKKRNKAYLVNGVPTNGWFSVDFTFKELSTVALTQGVYSRTNKFDGNAFAILTVKDVASMYKPPGFWLNVQHDQFFTQHNLSMRSFVISVSKSVIVNYISSPEVAFLKSITARFNPKTTKLVFRFLGQDETEPSTNQTYGSLLKNLTFVKTFASGIMVPKSYIWPVDANNYLLPHMSVVLDAHKEGLEVFASDFSNDVPFSFNYSYDPVTEFLNYVDNGAFSVDGVLTDFPITPSEAIDCFAHLGQNASAQAKALVISKYGASGDYPGCTDLAYIKAIDDHVDILDCPVQLAKDGTPFCLSSINLIDSTTVAQSSFSNLTRSIPAIKSGSGIFTFSLTWSQIQSLTPSIANPYAGYRLFRNPKYKNAGRYLTLADFLTLSKKASSLTGVLISIENAAYLAGEQGLDVIQAVKDALSKASYDNQVALRVMIQSTNSSVLQQFKDKTNYELVYKVDENIRDAANSAVGDIKKFAHAVVVSKTSVFPENNAFLTGVTDTVSKLQSFKLPVYVETFSNEFVSQAWDFFSDATVEINSYVTGASVDGVITDYPKTAARYKRNLCLLGKKTPQYMIPVEAGSLMHVITPDYMPPAEAPFPVLNESDVMEPPMPPVSATATAPSSSPGGVNTTIAPTSRNGQSKIASCFFLPYLAMLLSAFFLV